MCVNIDYYSVILASYPGAKRGWCEGRKKRLGIRFKGSKVIIAGPRGYKHSTDSNFIIKQS